MPCAGAGVVRRSASVPPSRSTLTTTFIRRAYVVNVATTAGHLQRSLAEMRTATELAPAEPLCAFHLGLVLALLRLDAEASRQMALAFDLGLSFGPAASGAGGYTLALIDLRAGRWRESAERFARGLAPELTAAGGSAAVQRACEAIVTDGNREAAAEALRAMEGKAGTALFNPFARSLLIQLYTMLGALDAAFSLGDRALDHLAASGMVGNIWGFLWEPELEPLRRDPR